MYLFFQLLEWSNIGRGCQVSVCGDIQNPTGHSSQQAALADPA